MAGTSPGRRLPRLRVPQLPAALQWDHNAHYHPWILRQLPGEPCRVLDVGCGGGLLASVLARYAWQVDAVDKAAHMIDQARARHADLGNVRWLVGDVLDASLPLAQRYDTVVALSSLHHMPLRPALARLASLVRPGGRLAIVGLYRHATLADYALDAIALPLNALVGAALAARGRAGKTGPEDMPVLDPVTTLGQVRAAASEYLPGARLHRALFFRYLLAWRRPAVRGAAPGAGGAHGFLDQLAVTHRPECGNAR